ncbi:MAG TPA: hypothetical protein ENK25_04665 [Bacteroidetes bacterium]|nr:hypothetical protein [Bacteroidota bacterium]
MKYLVRVLTIIFLAISLAGCSSSSKAIKQRNKRKKQIMINTTHLGKNKYFFSPKYQRKLSRKKRKK